MTVQLAQEVFLKAVCNIKAQTVNAKFVFPARNALLDIIFYIGIVKIELYKLVMTLPALVIETIVIGGVAAIAS